MQGKISETTPVFRTYDPLLAIRIRIERLLRELQHHQLSIVSRIENTQRRLISHTTNTLPILDCLSND
ncbi:hypothetical protein RB195_007483 [Necator americanus]|uniref:Uncharacterized protein n=1 Tax=Necator americanus TaxID=51031 RepID=A0ABR1BXH9_NECAM